LPPGQKKRGVSGHINLQIQRGHFMGNLRSQEKRQKRYNRGDANNLFLKYSYHDRLRAETVHTTETEKIVSRVLAEEYPGVPEAVFQFKF
jgi:hypothetical protein